MKLFKRKTPQSCERQMQDVLHEEVFTERELTAYEVKKVNQMQAWASRQRKLIYDELNPSVKEARA